MVAPEFILFVMLDILVLTWTLLKVLVVTYQLDYEPQPPRVTVTEPESSDHLRRAA